MSEAKTLQYLKQRILQYAGMADIGPPKNHGSKEPFRDGGLVFIHQPSFRKWLSLKYKFYCSQPMAMEALFQLKAQRRFLNFENKHGHMVWGIDIDTKPRQEEDLYKVEMPDAS